MTTLRIDEATTRAKHTMWIGASDCGSVDVDRSIRDRDGKSAFGSIWKAIR